MFQGGCNKDLTLNKVTIVATEKSPVTEEAEVPMISVIPGEIMDLDKGYYHGVYVLLYFNKQNIFDRKEDQAEMETDPDEEDMEDVRLDNERERHWRMVFKDNIKRLDDDYAMWDVYMKKK